MPSDSFDVDGIWTPTAYERNGHERPECEVASMAKLVLIGGSFLSGWSGLWMVLQMDLEKCVLAGDRVLDFCKRMVLGDERIAEPGFGDFYIYTGGRYVANPTSDPAQIRLEPYFQGSVLGVARHGIYQRKGANLTLCLADAGIPGPRSFSSLSQQSLQQFERIFPG